MSNPPAPIPSASRSQFWSLIFVSEDSDLPSLGAEERGQSGENLGVEALPQLDQMNPLGSPLSLWATRVTPRASRWGFMEKQKKHWHPALLLASCENFSKSLWPTVSSSAKWGNTSLTGLVRKRQKSLDIRQSVGYCLEPKLWEQTGWVWIPVALIDQIYYIRCAGVGWRAGLGEKGAARHAGDTSRQGQAVWFVAAPDGCCAAEVMSLTSLRAEA